MKKLMIILGIMIPLFTILANAQKTKQQVYVERTNPTIGTKLHRSPVLKPTQKLELVTDRNSIEVVSSKECKAVVTIYKAADNSVAIADINDTFLVPLSLNI